ACLREGLERLHSDGPRTGEDETVDVRIVDEFLPDRRSGTGEVIEHARWEAGVSEDFCEPKAHERRVARRLEDDRIAGDQGAGRHPGRNREGEGRGGDDGPHAVGLPDRPGRLPRAELAYRARV